MKKFKPVVKIIVSVALFGFILLKVNKQDLLSNFKLIDVRFLPAVFLLLVLNYVVSSVRWKNLLIYKNSEKVSLFYLVKLYFIGSFFNNFMPTSIGGDVFKVYKLGVKLESKANAFSATFMERFTGVIALFLIASVSTISLLGALGVLIFVGFWLAILSAFLSLKLLSRKIKALKSIYDSLLMYRNNRKVVLIAFVTSFIVQMLTILTQYLLFSAVGIHLPFFYSVFIFPVIILASFFIPSLNGVGVQDALYIKLFAVVGVAEPLSLSVSILFHLCRLFVSLIGGIMYAVGKAE